MKRLLMVGVVVVCWLAFLAGGAAAAPLFSATTTVDLNGMTLQTTGDLAVIWGEWEIVPQWSTGNVTSWLTDGEFGVSSEVGLEDLAAMPPGVEYEGTKYYGSAVSQAVLMMPFTVAGAGFLDIAVPYRIWYETTHPPDAVSAGDDFFDLYIALFQNGDDTWGAYRGDGDQNTNPGLYQGIFDTRGFGFPDDPLFFREGDTGLFRIFAAATSTVFYNELPVSSGGSSPAPVPEPATILLLGSGLAGAGLAGRRKRQN